MSQIVWDDAYYILVSPRHSLGPTFQFCVTCLLFRDVQAVHNRRGVLSSARGLMA